jgi:F0F1-type ATP synthase assembly protein I
MFDTTGWDYIATALIGFVAGVLVTIRFTLADKERSEKGLSQTSKINS